MRLHHRWTNAPWELFSKRSEAKVVVRGIRQTSLMEKKSTSRFPFVTLRALIALLLCVSACFVAVGTVPALLGAEARAKVSHPAVAGLTFAERVAYQRAIEEVYSGHRIWPKENARPKPSLDVVISQAQIEKKVEDYLRKSQLVADQRGWPITASELQAEMERMASHTLHPRVLLELFRALDNDPFVIAECLARPLVADRLVSDLTTRAEHPSFRAKSRNPAALPNGNSTRSFGFAQDDMAVNLNDAVYKLPDISVSLDCTDDTWTPITTVNAPDVREFYTAVWTGSEMIVWGGTQLHEWPAEHRRTIRSKHGQLDAYVPQQRAVAARLSQRRVDWHRDDRVGRRSDFEHRRQIQSYHR
jgi:hypothetical protein